MRALFEKDLRLLLIRKSTLLLFFVIGGIMTLSFSSTFSGAYLTMLGTMLALSTISYDDADHCMEFLFTLPCTRKEYVIEKYLFIYGASFLAGMIGLLIIVLSGILQGVPVTQEMIIEILLSELPILVISGGLMIPLQLKFGVEKSRIVLMFIIGGILAIGYLASQSAAFGSMIYRIKEVTDRCSPSVLLLVLLLILVMLSGVSVLITSRIIKKKEF